MNLQRQLHIVFTPTMQKQNWGEWYTIAALVEMFSACPGCHKSGWLKLMQGCSYSEVGSLRGSCLWGHHRWLTIIVPAVAVEGCLHYGDWEMHWIAAALTSRLCVQGSPVPYALYFTQEILPAALVPKRGWCTLVWEQVSLNPARHASE